MGKASTRAQKFQSTLPVGGATAPPLAPRRSAHDFNPRSPWGERQLSAIIPCVLEHFNPRSPWGERQRFFCFCQPRNQFQSTLPVGGATGRIQPSHDLPGISIHAPRGGSDVDWYYHDYVGGQFQSTLPVGGATGYGVTISSIQRISIHAPRGGSDGTGQGSPCSPRYFNPRSPWGERRSPSLWRLRSASFQSTLPVGGATVRDREALAAPDISIHAPRGGSDMQADINGDTYCSFQSTLPVGGAT